MNNIISDASEKEIDLIKNSKVEIQLEDVLGYYGEPEEEVTDLISFKQHLENDARKYESYNNNNFVDDKNKEFVKVEILTNNKIDYVMCHMTNYVYPNKYYIKVSRSPNEPLTNVELLALYTLAWRWMIDQELNLIKTNKTPKYGFIRGLDMLTYNGYSEVGIYENFVVAYFSVDS